MWCEMIDFPSVVLRPRGEGVSLYQKGVSMYHHPFFRIKGFLGEKVDRRLFGENSLSHRP